MNVKNTLIHITIMKGAKLMAVLAHLRMNAFVIQLLYIHIYVPSMMLQELTGENRWDAVKWSFYFFYFLLLCYKKICSYLEIQCPRNMIYQEYGTRCGRTCKSIGKPEICEKYHFAEGCNCPEGQ